MPAVPSVIDDLGDFIRDHRPHGPLQGDAGEPTANGYMVTVACPCRVTFYRWIALSTQRLLYRRSNRRHSLDHGDTGCRDLASRAR
jgi:hypothetical protein